MLEGEVRIVTCLYWCCCIVREGERRVEGFGV